MNTIDRIQDVKDWMLCKSRVADKPSSDTKSRHCVSKSEQKQTKIRLGRDKSDKRIDKEKPGHLTFNTQVCSVLCW